MPTPTPDLTALSLRVNDPLRGLRQARRAVDVAAHRQQIDRVMREVAPILEHLEALGATQSAVLREALHANVDLGHDDQIGLLRLELAQQQRLTRVRALIGVL